jgi:RHS repeat-associated protein
LSGISGYKPDCSALTASFKYDAWGRRIEKTINGRTINYLYGRYDIVQEIESGVPTVNYIRTLNIDEPLARIDLTTNTVRYYHTDALGSIIGLSDENGQEATQYAYDPFGNVTITGEISDNPFQYTGRENDGTGLYFYRARYYSPELQRFLSEDPIRLKGGINFFAYTDSVGKPLGETNLYLYTANNPVNRKDPKGLNWHGNWCGPGGSGPATDCYDAACRRHDHCYEDCGVDWLSRWAPWRTSHCEWKCDEELLKDWKKCACSHGASGSW